MKEFHAAAKNRRSVRKMASVMPNVALMEMSVYVATRWALRSGLRQQGIKSSAAIPRVAPGAILMTRRWRCIVATAATHWAYADQHLRQMARYSSNQ
jgi:NADP-dependent 3-hydroxy acid dehydrogenase YdfG